MGNHFNLTLNKFAEFIMGYQSKTAVAQELRDFTGGVYKGSLASMLLNV